MKASIRHSLLARFAMLLESDLDSEGLWDDAEHEYGRVPTEEERSEVIALVGREADKFRKRAGR